MTDHVTWTTPFLRAQKAINTAGELLELKRGREGMLLLIDAQRNLTDCMEFILKERAK